VKKIAVSIVKYADLLVSLVIVVGIPEILFVFSMTDDDTMQGDA
jgi:hypothetical protein